MIAVTLLLFFALGTTGSCQNSNSLTDANTGFALDAYRRLTTTGGNVFFSPLSLSIIMGMLYEGSNGTTRSQLQAVAGFDRVNDVAAEFRELSSVLNTPSKNYDLEAANRVYARKNYGFNKNYLKTVQNQYQSDIIASDFQFNAEMVRQQINRWVENKTKDKIRNLIPQNALKPETAMVLVNAIYFKGDWDKKFKAASTKPNAFYLSAKTINTPMMYQRSKFRVFNSQRNGYRVLEMPYKGNDLSMLVVLPKEIDGLAKVEKLLTHDELSNVHNSMRYSPQLDVMVTMPKFKIDVKYKMKDHLKAMGIGDLFKPRACDLSGIDGTRDLYVSEMFHQAFVDVNEEGSEAAAATGSIIAVITSVVVRPTFPIEFKADHPFLFYIRDNKSGSVLFMGRYSQP